MFVFLYKAKFMEFTQPQPSARPLPGRHCSSPLPTLLPWWGGIFSKNAFWPFQPLLPTDVSLNFCFTSLHRVLTYIQLFVLYYINKLVILSNLPELLTQTCACLLNIPINQQTLVSRTCSFSCSQISFHLVQQARIRKAWLFLSLQVTSPLNCPILSLFLHHNYPSPGPLQSLM